MTVIAKCLLEAKLAEASQAIQYTAPIGTRTIIDKCTATNVTGSPATIAWSVVPNGLAADASNTVVQPKTIAANAADLTPEMVGHILNPGDAISTLAGTASAIVIRISGRELS